MKEFKEGDSINFKSGQFRGRKGVVAGVSDEGKFLDVRIEGEAIQRRFSALDLHKAQSTVQKENKFLPGARIRVSSRNPKVHGQLGEIVSVDKPSTHNGQAWIKLDEEVPSPYTYRRSLYYTSSTRNWNTGVSNLTLIAESDDTMKNNVAFTPGGDTIRAGDFVIVEGSSNKNPDLIATGLVTSVLPGRHGIEEYARVEVKLDSERSRTLRVFTPAKLRKFEAKMNMNGKDKEFDVGDKVKQSYVYDYREYLIGEVVEVEKESGFLIISWSNGERRRAYPEHLILIPEVEEAKKSKYDIISESLNRVNEIRIDDLQIGQKVSYIVDAPASYVTGDTLRKITPGEDSKTIVMTGIITALDRPSNLVSVRDNKYSSSQDRIMPVARVTMEEARGKSKKLKLGDIVSYPIYVPKDWKKGDNLPDREYNLETDSASQVKLVGGMKGIILDLGAFEIRVKDIRKGSKIKRTLKRRHVWKEHSGVEQGSKVLIDERIGTVLDIKEDIVEVIFQDGSKLKRDFHTLQPLDRRDLCYSEATN